MNSEVVFLKEAQADIDAVYTYILNQSPQGAAHWLDALEAAIDALGQNPKRYARAPENELVSATIQNLSFKTRRGRPYRLVYTIVGEQVRVFRLLGPGQDLLRLKDFK